MKSKFIIIFIFFSAVTFGQNITIIGWVYDFYNNKPMPLVNEFFEAFGELKSGACTDTSGLV